MTTRIKICGITSEDALHAAVQAGAHYVGFVHFPPSPRHVTIDHAARLRAMLPPSLEAVAVVVDADDATLASIVAQMKPSMLQLHGREIPARVSEIRNTYRVPVMKAIGIATASDLAAARSYVEVADRLLLDAKPPLGATLPGGNATRFDWALLHGFATALPWMLSGGLTPENVSEALRISGAKEVDVSSGVESAPGVKNVEKIFAFCSAVAKT